MPDEMDKSPETGLTTDQVKASIEARAGGAEALDAATLGTFRGEQSPDPIQQQIDRLGARVRELETERDNRASLDNAGNLVPGTDTGTVMDRVHALEATVLDHADSVPFFHTALAALNEHFGGKLSFLVPALPAPSGRTTQVRFDPATGSAVWKSPAVMVANPRYDAITGELLPGAVQPVADTRARYDVVTGRIIQ